MTQKLYRIKEFAFKHPWASISRIHNYIFNEERNGLLESRAIVREGGKVYIDEDKYIAWILSRDTMRKRGYLHKFNQSIRRQVANG